MSLGFWYDARRIPGKFGSLLGVVLVLGLVAGAMGDVPKDVPKDVPAGGRGLSTSTVALQTTVAVNRVIMALTDRGGVGAIPGSVAGGGFWRATTDQYIFASGVNVGATVAKPSGGLDTLIMLGGPFTQLRPGGVVPFQTRSGATLPGADLGVFWRATDPQDFANFPLPCTVDAFRIGLFPTLAPFEGEPFPGFADETVCWAVNDVDGAPCSSCGGARLGGEIQMTAFAFSVPAVQDYFFVIFRVHNRSEFVTPATTPGNSVFGPYDFMNTVVAIAIDPDLGDAGDDQIGFLPAPVNTMVWWDSDFSEPDFQFQPPGFGGVSYLKTPEDPVTGEEVGLQSFTVFTNSTTRPDPTSRQEWYQGMTGDPNFVVFDVPADDVRGMASSGQFPLPAGEFVEIYAAYFFAEAFGALPTELLTNNAIVNGEPIAIFNNFVAAQAGVQGVFDAGFLVPTAPPSPEFELIPGDHQVTVVWDASSIQAVNSFARVARDPFLRDDAGNPDPNAPGLGIFLAPTQVVFVPALDTGGTTGFVTASVAGLTGQEVTNPFFDPDFVIQDFEGFRVYRSRTGNATLASESGNPDDAVLIAQFDLNNAITEGDFCISGQAVVDEETGELIEAVCTGTQFLQLGTNTGLVFGLTDRGGVFPNPSDGPGLINGIPVFYAVTSFGVNCGVLTVQGIDEQFASALDPPPGCLTLESGLQLRPATPRSNASSFVDATVQGPAELISNETGTVLTPAAVLPLDAEGNLTGPIPPAQSWSATVEVLQAELIPADFEIRIVIDSIPARFEWFGLTAAEFWEVGVGFDRVPSGDGRAREIFFHLEDANGNPLNSPEGPARGSFFTGFIPFDGTLSLTSPPLSILSPSDPDAGPVAVVQWTTTVGERNDMCDRAGNCVLTTSVGGDAPPASVANFDFEVGLYGSVTYADLELTWGNSGGVLTLTSVRDLTHDVAVPFASGFGAEGWGFAAPTGAGAAEVAEWDDGTVPKTADGRYLYGDPLWSGVGGQNFQFSGGIIQSGADYTDLPTMPNVFDLLAAHLATFTAPFLQTEAFESEATLFTCPAAGGGFGCGGAGAGKQGTRLWLRGHWLQVAFNQLPADGEVWVVRLPSGQANAPRMPVPGTAVRFQLSGGTNELAAADLQAIKVVPNPFIAANEITRGRGRQRILFTNLPPQATIRIYTISGNLVRILEHGDGSGTEEWDVRTRFDLLVASGNYYYHVTTPDGRTHLGRFAVIN